MRRARNAKGCLKGQRPFKKSSSPKSAESKKVPKKGAGDRVLWRSRRRRLERDGDAVGLEVDGVALGVASLAARGDVGAAGLLDGDGHCDCWSAWVLLDLEDEAQE